MYKLIPWNGNSSESEFIILSGDTTTGNKTITIDSPANKSTTPRSKTLELYTTYPSETVTQQIKIVQEGYQIPVNTVYDFAFTSDIEEIQLTRGAYKLQVWGAQGEANEADAGHNITSQAGGKGGYSEGILLLNEDKTLYVTVGGQPDPLNPSFGGFNGGGGGSSGTSSYGAIIDQYGAVISKAGKGGGATDISTVGSEEIFTSTTISKTTESLLSRFIVAGGGSGGAMCEKRTCTPKKSWVNISTLSDLTNNAIGTVNNISYSVIQSGSDTGTWGYVTAIYFDWDELVFNDGDKIRVTYQNAPSDATVRIYWAPESGSGNSQVDVVSNRAYTSPLVFTEDNSKKPSYKTRLLIQLYSYLSRYQGPLIIEKESDYTLLLTEFPTNKNFYPNGDVSPKIWQSANNWRGYQMDVTQYRGQLLTLTSQTGKSVQCTFYKSEPVAGQTPDYATGVPSLGWWYRGPNTAKMIVPSDAVYVYFLTDAGTAGGNERTPASVMFQEYDVTIQTAAQEGFAGGGLTGGGYNDNYKGGQTSAGTNGSFGIGSNLRGNGNNRYMPGAGGGGWYGGGSAYSQSVASIDSIRLCGGGSGFVNTSANASSRPANYTGLELLSGTTYSGTETFESPNGGTETGHEGNGYARITAIDEYEYRYFTVEALDNSSFSFTTNDLIVSKNNGQTWTTLAVGETYSLNMFEKAWIKQTDPTIASSYGIGTFTFTGNVKVSGNIMSLLYGDDFIGQKSLSGKNYVFYKLFQSCANLTDAENLVLPAITLSVYCYSNMFYESGIVKGPKVLPATAMTSHCYDNMFYNTPLVKAPDIKATSLSDNCFNSMFLLCECLTEAPVLYSSSIWNRNSCYFQMFTHCSSLNHVICLASTFFANKTSRAMANWLKDTNSTGVIEIKKGTTSNWNEAYYIDSTIIPTGWTLKELDYNYNDRYNYLIMTVKSGTGSIYLTIPSGLSTSNYEYIEWSTDKSTWNRVNNVDNQQVIATTSSVSTGNVVYFRGSGVAMSTETENCDSVFSSDNDMEIIISGKLMALCGTDRVAPYMFKGLFSADIGSFTFVSIKDLIFPDTTNTGCYQAMFYGQKITDAPELPAKIMSEQCYYQMFTSSSIVKAPELPAIQLAYGCYFQMFEECQNLTEGPSAIRGELDKLCCAAMFYGCVNLVKAPSLPETISSKEGVDRCYTKMFSHCSTLKETPILLPVKEHSESSSGMFELCYNLKKIIMPYPNADLSSIVGQQFNGGGTLYKGPQTYLEDSEIEGSSWQVIDDYENTYFTIESLVDNNAIKISKSGSFTNLTVSISRDCKTWTDVTLSSGLTLATLNTGDTLYIAGNNARYTNGSTSELYRFYTTGNYNVYGNIMSLIYGHNFYNQKTLTATYTFTSLFYHSTTLVSAKNLILPAVNLTANCYRSMFNGCTSLVRGPKLPAMNLVENCYLYMFINCSSLTRIDAMFYTTPGTSYTSAWVSGVPNQGVFVKNIKATWTNTGATAVPTGWTVKTMPYETEVLIPFEVLEQTICGSTNGSLTSRDYGFVRKYNVTAGETYYATAYAPQTSVYYINWMDGQGNRIGTDLQGDGTTNKIWEDEPVTAPVGAVEMWMNCRYPDYADNQTYLFMK